MRRLLWLTFFVGIGGVGWFVWRKVTGPVSHGPIADAPPHANPERMPHVATSTSPESTNGDSDAPPDHGHEAVVKKATAKKTAAKKTAAKKAAAKKTAAKKATAKKTAAKKATAKKSPAKKTATKKVPADQPETSSTASSTEERPEA